jgi:hypothetical protein
MCRDLYVKITWLSKVYWLTWCDKSIYLSTNTYFGSGSELSSYMYHTEYHTKFRKWRHASGQHHFLWTGQHWMSGKHRGVLTPTWRGLSQWDLGIRSGRIIIRSTARQKGNIFYIRRTESPMRKIQYENKRVFFHVCKIHRKCTGSSSVENSDAWVAFEEVTHLFVPFIFDSHHLRVHLIL